ncbi:N-acetyl-alpha-D-glucosaminyl L-malate synthase [subsurface metagenome]
MSRITNRKASRVLIISEHFLPTLGGTTFSVYNLCKCLAEIGWEVYLITEPSRTDTKGRWYNQDGINIYRLNIPNIFMKEVLLPRSFLFYLLKQINHVVNELCPDIIHFAIDGYAIMSTRLRPGFTHIPIVWTIRNPPPAEHHLNIIRNDKLNKPFELLYFKAVKIFTKLSLRFNKYNRIIAVSKVVADKVVKEGVSPNKIRIIPNAIDTQYFTTSAKRETKQPNAQYVVLTVGGIIEHKGQLNIIKSATDIIARFPNVLFLLVGPIRSKYYSTLLQEAIRELRLEQNVKLVGAVSQEDLLSYYQLCDLYLQPSLEEGFCRAILEAMACGKPVIGTPVGEIPKFITESRAGILIPDSLPAEISRAVIKLLASEEVRRELGERAREYVAAGYSWQAVARQTVNLYHEIIEKAKL